MNMKILVIAPHADDEVLGMGGTIARFAEEGKTVVVAVMTGHGAEPHPLWPKSTWDTVRAECQAAADILGVSEIIFEDLPAACLDSTPTWKINGVVEKLVERVSPQEIYLPFAYDLHKDHGSIAYAVNVAIRPYLARAGSVRKVLAYETLSETHLAPPYLAPAFQPNVFFDISDTLQCKLDAMRAYQSQIQADNLPRSIAALSALAILRGTHIGCNAAEGFVLLGEYNR